MSTNEAISLDCMYLRNVRVYMRSITEILPLLLDSSCNHTNDVTLILKNKI